MTLLIVRHYRTLICQVYCTVGQEWILNKLVALDMNYFLWLIQITQGQMD